jgi:hypothetical protein
MILSNRLPIILCLGKMKSKVIFVHVGDKQNFLCTAFFFPVRAAGLVDDMVSRVLEL